MGGASASFDTPQGKTGAPQQQAADDKPGLQKLRDLAGKASAPPAVTAAAFLMQQYPADKDAMVGFLNQTYGNAYTQQVSVAAQSPISAADAAKVSAIAPGAGGSKGGPGAKADIKDPAADLGAVSKPEYDQARGVFMNDVRTIADQKQGNIPAPPASVYPVPYWQQTKDANPADRDQRDGKQRAVDQAVTDGNARVPLFAPKDDAGRVAPDSATQNGNQRTVSGGGTTTANGITTSQGTSRITGDAPVNADQQLAAYKKSASTAIDDQLTALTPKHQDGTPPDVAAAKAKLEDAKKQVTDAKSLDDVTSIVMKNKLPVARPDNTIAAAQQTNTGGVSPSGLLYGSPIAQRDNKTASVQYNTDGTVVTNTSGVSSNVSTKGIDLSQSSSKAVQNMDGSARVDSSKTSVTGGITDPLKTNYSSTTTKQQANGDTRTNSWNAGTTQGDGFGGMQGGASTVNKDGRGASVNGSAGMLQDDKGTGAKLGVDDARMDAGGTVKGKPVTGGIYGSFDASMQFLVTPNDDGGITVTMTAQAHAKLGLFAGKRDPKDPVESGNEAHGGLSGGKTEAGSVTKSRKYSAADAQKVMGDLDRIANSSEGGKRTFGTKASIDAACQCVFGQVFGSLVGDSMPVDGETDTRMRESGWNADAKLGGSTGDDAKSRTGGDVNANYSNTKITGGEDSQDKGVYTRKVLAGNRTSYGGGATVSEGAANGGGSLQHTDQGLHTYIFIVPAGDAPELVQARKELHAIKDGDEAAAKAYAAAHADYYRGVVDGDKTTDEGKANAGVGPLGVKGGTTETVDTNVLKGQHVEIGPDGKKKIVKDLSGTAEGTQSNDSSISAFGVDVAKGNTTTAAKGTVDPDGQASLDVNTATTDSNLLTSKAKNKTDTSDAAAAIVTGGPMGLVKRLAERVGETSTVGAHFDDASFNQLVGCAQDQHRWVNATSSSCSGEWNTLRNQLNSPNPPADWLAQDESEGHVAANQLYRMKMIAKFIASTGKDGQDCISRVRGEYGANAIGQTVSFPKSIADKKAVFDDLAKQVEHLKPTLLGFANAGDAEGGKALLAKLDKDLGTLRDQISNATDHEDTTLGVRAASGVGDMQLTVEKWGPKFDAAIKAQAAKGDVAAALEDAPAKSTQLWHKREDDGASAAQVAAKTKEMEKTGAAHDPGKQATDKQWADYDKAHQQQMDAQDAADKKVEADHQAENDARDAEAKSAAEKGIPKSEATCLDCKGRAFALLDQSLQTMKEWFSSDEDTMNKLSTLQTLMREWDQDWSVLADYYKKTGKPPGTRDDLRPGLESGKLSQLMACKGISDWTHSQAEQLKNRYGRL
jgi:hypothetical protein